MLAVGATYASVEAETVGPGTAIASVSIESRGDAGVLVLGEVLALADLSVHAELKVTKRGRSGEVVTAQARDLQMAPGDRAIIARLEASFAAGDTLTVAAVVSENDMIISTASVTAGINP